MNAYHEYVKGLSDLVLKAKSLPLGGFAPSDRPKIPANAPQALFFSPHPDDECISGGIALRILREAGMQTVNVAVTQGSRKDRQAERYNELKNACNYLGFGLIQTAPNGLEKITPKARQQDPAHWEKCTGIIAGVLKERQPKVIMFPHEHDWNGTHIGVHYLVMDALHQMPSSFECYLVETEFWGQMTDPNLMVELSAKDVADLMAGISFHVGEVNRNPYHILLPAWMMDNVRRGGEVVGGQGGAVPDFLYAALYRFRKWSGGTVIQVHQGGRQISAKTNIADLFKD